ncbi:glycoside hydrolase family 3 protein [Alkaliflexus imshenetskii]|uniref:glycoside hydrolase family 3 protein n=1 Tax=Alkaliflexus imshenetskii TaxID=286730 RepID=UPI0004B7DD7C|nr:glycoside hydrolase family 3 N-terminal domain-containing protein [Alkaliflexus imshenetskii]
MVSLLFGRLLPLIFLMLLGCSQITAPAQEEASRIIFPDMIYDESRAWVDSVYESLSERQKIAQLFWLAVENVDNQVAYGRLKSLVKEHQPGGILLFRMRPERAQQVITDLQSESELRLLVSIDGEWGLAMRFADVTPFPYAMTLGAIQDDSLIFRMGLEMARQFRLMGIHVNMAPVADVNSNPNNPVIGHRSFGEIPDNVSRKAVAYMQGLQEGGVMAVGKHFPGHGDTDTDSHKTLPIVNHTLDRLNEMDLPPFRALTDAGIWAVMTAHIEVPALEATKGVPSSFSKGVIEDLLRKQMGFNGLVITDAVNMQGAKVMGRPGVVDALALAAGNDIVEFTENLPAAIEEVLKFIESGQLSWAQIEDKCRRSLAFKYWLTERLPSGEHCTEDIVKCLNSVETYELNQKLHNAALTVLRNENEALPLSGGFSGNYACVVLGSAPSLSADIRIQFKLPVYELSTSDGAAFDRVISSLDRYDGFVIVVADTRWGRLAANQARKMRLMRLAEKGRSVSVFMGNAYHLASWSGLTKSTALIVSYQNNVFAERAVMQLLQGKITANGQLPVSVGELFNAGDGINIPK